MANRGTLPQRMASGMLELGCPLLAGGNCPARAVATGKVKNTVKIEIWSDVVCPWCFIGKRRLEAALAHFDAADVQIEYRAFELDPSTGRDKSVSEAQMLASKYGRSLAEAQQMLEQVTATAASVGLAYDFASVVPANTFAAHQVLALAAERGVQPALKEALLAAHFEQGLDVEDPEVLATLGAQAGLDAAEVRAALADGRYAGTVRAQQAEARELGITGVPFFVFDRRYGVSGAQPPEVFRQALAKAAGS